MFSDTGRIPEAFRSRRADIAGLRSREYLELRDKMPLTPLFVPKRRGRIQQESQPLIHGQSDIQAIEDPPGKDIRMLVGMEGSLAKAWLENILMERGYSSLGGSLQPRKPAERCCRCISARRVHAW